LYCLFTPIIYNNADLLKSQITSDNKGKSGIADKIDGKRYVGSSSDLKRRLQQYFNINYLNKNTCMRICRGRTEVWLFQFLLRNFRIL
jgi:hypothetical protein